MKVLAIDPGPVESAYIVWDGERPEAPLMRPNKDIEFLMDEYDLMQHFQLVVEKVECYGMPVGKSIFETVYWTGRFCRAFDKQLAPKRYAIRIPRKDVKMHLCGQVRAKDSNVIQALVDRFTPFEKNKGKGTKKNPGFFFGFKKDIWQAFALAVTWWDQNAMEEQKRGVEGFEGV